MVVAILMSGVLSGLLGACAPQPLLPFTTDTPPTMLTVAGPASGIDDQRARFRQILCAVAEDHGRRLPDYRDCAQLLWRLGGEAEVPADHVYLGPPRLPLRVVVIGGLAAECAAGFVPTLPSAIRHLNDLGYSASELPVSGLGSTTFNGRLIADAVLRMDLAKNERLILLGYSKGLPDILEGLADSPDAARRVSAVVGLAGAVNGSPLTENAPEELFSTLQNLPPGDCRVGDGEALDSLRQGRRLTWMSTHALPRDVRYFSLGVFAERERISQALRGNHDRLSLMDPRNDGQLLVQDQIIPGSTLLGYINADHWAVTMPINRAYPTLSKAFANRSPFPREILLEAIVRDVEESLIKAGTKPSGRVGPQTAKPPGGTKATSG